MEEYKNGDEEDEYNEYEDEVLDPEEIRQLMLDLDPNDPQRIWFFREDGPNGPDPVDLRNMHHTDEIYDSAVVHINKLKNTQPQSVEEEPVYDFTKSKNNNDRDPPGSIGMSNLKIGGTLKKSRKGEGRRPRKKTKKSSRKTKGKKNKRYTKRR
jgi:hypothetical protein